MQVFYGAVVRACLFDIVYYHKFIFGEIFRNGKRCDESVTVAGIKPNCWAAFEHQGKRLLMLLNFSAKDVTVHVEQPNLQGQWQVRLHGKEQPLKIDPAKFEMTIEPFGARVMVLSKHKNHVNKRPIQR